MAVSKYNHVFIAEAPTSLSFTSGKSMGKEPRFPTRNRTIQGEALRYKLDCIWKAEITEKEKKKSHCFAC